MTPLSQSIPMDRLRAFCHRWRVTNLSLFGSVLRPDFGPHSDVDILIAFDPSTEWSLFDIITMREELAELFGRPVDLVEEGAVRNPYMLASINRTKRVLYAA